MINRAKLKGKMAEKGEKQKDLAIIIGRTLKTTNLKLNGKIEFNETEQTKIIEHYGKEVAQVF